jgi:hypothetical protein
MNRLKSGISVLLLFVLGLAFIPKEYVHSLYGHEDDHCLPQDSPGIGKIHHHCKILQLIPYVFFDTGKQILPEKQTYSENIFVSLYQEAILPPALNDSPRAPPVNC